MTEFKRLFSFRDGSTTLISKEPVTVTDIAATYRLGYTPRCFIGQSVKVYADQSGTVQLVFGVDFILSQQFQDVAMSKQIGRVCYSGIKIIKSTGTYYVDYEVVASYADGDLWNEQEDRIDDVETDIASIESAISAIQAANTSQDIRLSDHDAHVSDTVIHVSQSDRDKWDGKSRITVVNNIAGRDALSPSNGDFCVVLDDGDGKRASYIWNGSSWIKESDQDWENVNLSWAAISDIPSSPSNFSTLILPNQGSTPATPATGKVNLFVQNNQVKMVKDDGAVVDVSGGAQSAVSSVAGRTGDIVLNTADVADSTDKRYVSDAMHTVLGNTSGTNTGDETKTTINTKIANLASDVYGSGYSFSTNDGIGMINARPTTQDIPITLPVISQNENRRIVIRVSAQSGTYKVTISPNAADSNKLTNDALASINLVEVGDMIELLANTVTGYWEVVRERLTSEISVQTSNGYGSSETYIPKFSTLRTSKGNAITENHSTNYPSGQGFRATCQRTGKYAVTYTFAANTTNCLHGISKNANSTVTSISSITATGVMAAGYAGTSPVTISQIVNCKKGDIIRPHGDTVIMSNTACNMIFTITYLG